jgi:hypothetical protein
MVPDKDRRAIERKVFPAEVDILLTRYPRLVICPETSPHLGQRKTDVLPRTYDHKTLLEGRRTKSNSAICYQGLWSSPNHGSGKCSLQYSPLPVLISKYSLYVVIFAPCLQRNS